MKHFSRRQNYFRDLVCEYLSDHQKLNLDGKGTNSLASWFLGPKAENADFFREMLNKAFLTNCEDRKRFFENDPLYISAYRKNVDYKASLEQIEEDFTELLEELQNSVPFFSYRYQAHMNWDLTMPGLLAYFAAMLYNQNNVALEASPVTSRLEALVGDDLCKMLGYSIPLTEDDMRPWGHITCDGSIANLEAMWAARNLKYYPISLVQTILNNECLTEARNLTVVYKEDTRCLIHLNTWELLNLKIDVIFSLTDQIKEVCGIDSEKLNNAIEPYLLQSTGMIEFHKKYLQDVNHPILMGTATKHYSWPKNAAALGIGKDSFINVTIDKDARMNIQDLATKIEISIQERNPILMVVAVLGSTEQSAVDPLQKLVQLREEYREQGIEFAIHVDSAWGGYFASMLRGEKLPEPQVENYDLDKQHTPVLEMSPYVKLQYQSLSEADTITVDPHKAGYIPYPAGALCYRNKKMRNLIAFLASEVYHDESLDANMGVFGIEGSKPGAAAAAVYLSHKLIRPDRSGYGKILGKALFNSKRFFSAIITMAEKDDPFIVVPVQQIPAEKAGENKKQIHAQLAYIKKHIVSRQNNELLEDEIAMRLLNQLGSDQIIITYGFNFKDKDGRINKDPELANAFNHAIFSKLSIRPDSDEVLQTPLIVTTSEFDPETYGDDFVRDYMKRLHLKHKHPITMNFISSTTMCPWLTATEKGNFIPHLTDAFRKTILQVIEDYYKNEKF